MTDAIEALKRFERLDEALARDVERRRRIRIAYWLIVAAALVALALILKFGKSAEETAQEYVESEEFVSELSSNPILVEGLSRQDFIKDFRQEIFDRLDVIDAQLRVDEDLPPDPKPDEDFAAASDLLALEEALNTHQHATPIYLEARLQAIELRQNTLESSQSEFEIRLQTVESRQSALEALYNALVDRVRSSTSSHLLKETETNGLPGLDLEFTLGKRRSDGIEVTVSAKQDSQQIYFNEKVSFGIPFKFQDLEKASYSATLTGGQSRFIWKDFVVLDLVRIAKASQQGHPQ